MGNAGGHRDKLASSDKNLSISKFHNQLSVHSAEGLVGVRMAVPTKLLGHGAHPNLMVIHFTK